MKEIEEFIEDNMISIIYFSGSICGACDAIKEKVLHVIKDYKEVKFLEINAVENKEIAAEYNIFFITYFIVIC